MTSFIRLCVLSKLQYLLLRDSEVTIIQPLIQAVHMTTAHGGSFTPLLILVLDIKNEAVKHFQRF